MRMSDWSSDVCSSDLVRSVVECPASGVIGARPQAWQKPEPRPEPCRRTWVKLHPTPSGRRSTVDPWTPPATTPPACTACSPPCARTFRHRRSEEHTSELQSLMRISYAVFCLKKKKKTKTK